MNKANIIDMLKPSAHSTTLCEIRGSKFTKFDLKIQSVMADMTVSKSIKALIDLMYTNALRVSEVLQLETSNIYSSNSVVIKGCKGSNSKLAHLSYIVGYFDLFNKQYNVKIFPYDRYFVYRQFKKIGLEFQSKISEYNQVTHCLRTMQIKKIDEFAKNDELTQQIAGHKKMKNTLYYVNKK